MADETPEPENEGISRFKKIMAAGKTVPGRAEPELSPEQIQGVAESPNQPLVKEQEYTGPTYRALDETGGVLNLTVKEQLGYPPRRGGTTSFDSESLRAIRQSTNADLQVQAELKPGQYIAIKNPIESQTASRPYIYYEVVVPLQETSPGQQSQSVYLRSTSASEIDPNNVSLMQTELNEEANQKSTLVLSKPIPFVPLKN